MSQNIPELKPGRVFGDYQLVERVGRGGFGEVWKARRRHWVIRGLLERFARAVGQAEKARRPPNRYAALKFVPKPALEGEMQGAPANERQGERAVEKLVHPHLIPIYERWESAHFSIIAMELADCSLDRRLSDCRKAGRQGISPAELLEYIQQAAKAIDYLNEHHVVHCDIKPENLLLVGKQVKVADFDSAQLVERSRTHRDARMTLDCAAPEVVVGDIDRRFSDQYSLAATYCKLRTGHSLFPGVKRDWELMRAQVMHQPNLGDLPPEEQRAVKQALSKKPEERFESCQAFVAELRKSIEDAEAARAASASSTPEIVAMQDPDEIYKIVKEAAEQGCKLWQAEAKKEEQARAKQWRWFAEIAVVAPSALLVLAAIGWLLGMIPNSTGGSAGRENEQLRDELRAVPAKLDDGFRRLDDRLDAGFKKLENRPEIDHQEMASYRLHLRLADQALDAHNLEQARVWLDAGCPLRLRDWEWRHLKRRCTGETQPSTDCPSGVLSVAISPDGKRVAAGLADGAVKIYEAGTLTEVTDLKFEPHSKGVTGLLFSRDGTRLVSAGQDGMIHNSDVKKGGHRDFSADTRGAVRPATWVAVAAISPDGSTLAYNGEHGSDKPLHWVTLVNAADGTHKQYLKGHEGEVTSLAFAPDGKTVVSGSRDGTVRVWNAVSGQEVHILRGHSDEVTSVAISEDGGRIVSGSRDATVRVWSAQTGEELLVLRGHALPVASVAFVGTNSQRIISAGHDWTLRVWDTHDGAGLLTLKGHARKLLCTAVSADGQYIVSGDGDPSASATPGKVLLWNGELPSFDLVFKGHTDRVIAVAFSPDGKRLASASGDKTVRVWDAGRGQEVLSLKGHTSPVYGVAFSPDGQRLASASEDGTVRVWDAGRGQEVLSLKGHTGPVYGVAFSPDGQRLISGSSDDKTVRVWDLVTGKEALTLKGHTDTINDVCFSPDGKHLASASSDGTVRLWDAATGKEEFTLKGHTGSFVHGVCFSPDGKRLASASSDETVRVWDTITGKEEGTFKGHIHQVCGVCFSPDGKQLASASYDETVRVWDAATGQQGLTLKGHTGGVNGVCFSPDGKRLASASSDETVRVWLIAP